MLLKLLLRVPLKTLFIWTFLIGTPSLTHALSFTALTGYKNHSLFYGGLVDYKLFKALSLQIGALYGKRGFQENTFEQATTYSWNALEFPLLIRYTLFPRLTLGLGAYFSYALGSYSLETSGSPTSSTFGHSFGLSTYSATDYGGVLSLALKIRILSWLGLMADARKLFGLENISHFANKSIFLRDTQVFIGITFGKF